MAEHTSDMQPRPNGFTREAWLQAILHSPECTKIGQHLALVIYHMSDPATNVATLSARDLQRITGWGRTAIVDHLAEIEVFIRVTWGQGRAKSLFELQGLIADVLEEQREKDVVASQAATTKADPDTVVASQTATTPEFVASQAATTIQGLPATQAATTVVATSGGPLEPACGHLTRPQAVVASQATAIVASQTAIKTEKSSLGGTIGGEINNYPSKVRSLSPPHEGTRGAAENFQGVGFEGAAFDLSALDVAALEVSYKFLPFPEALVAADKFFARQFEKQGDTSPMHLRLGRLHQLLRKQNAEAEALNKTYDALIANGKGERTTEPIDPVGKAAPPLSCWFDDDARLQVANGFKSELLEAVGGDDIRLRTELDKAAGWVGVSLKGLQLMAKVRARITEQVKGRGPAATGGVPPQETANQRRARMVEAAMARADERGGRRT